jgi:hypothetical protein
VVIGSAAVDSFPAAWSLGMTWLAIPLRFFDILLRDCGLVTGTSPEYRENRRKPV